MKTSLKILAVTGIYLFSLCILSTDSEKSVTGANSEVYAGRFDKAEEQTKYNLSGLPISRKWLTYQEWQGQHIPSNDYITRSRFKSWKQIHIQTFIKFIGNAVRQECKQFPDLIPSVIISQAILESNFGLSRIAVEGNNLFGHKYRGKTKGFLIAHDDSPTDKFESGFKSQWFSIRAHSHLLNDKYKKRIQGKPTVEKWLTALCGGLSADQSKEFRKKTGGFLYATSCQTSPCYSKKLNQIIKKYDLKRFDFD